MPVNFWLSLVLLIVLALVFVIQPMLFQRPGGPSNDRRGQNLSTYRSRLRELEQERDDGLLDESTFESLRDELELSLLQDVEQEGDRGTHTENPGGRRGLVLMTLALCLVIPVSALYLYQTFGAQQALAEFRQMQEFRGGNVDQQDIESMVQGLRDRLSNEPDNAEGWAMLARSYMNLERYSDAADAYQNLAAALERTGEGGAASAWGLRAQALFVANQGQMTRQVQKAIEEAQSRDPDEVNALGLMGIQAFRNGDYRDALKHWERILEIAPDHPQAESIRQGVVAAYSELGEPVPEYIFAEG